MHSITPLDGWLLNEAVALDLAHPGFVGSLLRASTERRHVSAAFLAVSNIKEADRAEVATFLARADHRTILTAAFQRVPRACGAPSQRAVPSRMTQLITNACIALSRLAPPM